MSLSIAQRREGVLAEIGGDFPMDVAVIEILPPDSKVLAAESYGDSVLTQTGRITVELPSGDVKKYFLKLAVGENGRQLCRGEYTAISLINALIPGMVPKAVGWGEYTVTPPQTFFLVEEFHRLDMSLPDPKALAHRTVELHNAAANGVWHELSRAAEHLLQNIVPQLLDPLQEGPNLIKPRLIHGDLWSGNIGTDEQTGEIMFLDVGSFYGHNELDLGMWRRYGAQNLGQLYLDEYKCIFPPSEPKQDFDDRNRLYSIKFDLNASAGAPNERARNTAFNNILYLVEKHAPLEYLPRYDPLKDPAAGMGYIHADK